VNSIRNIGDTSDQGYSLYRRLRPRGISRSFTRAGYIISDLRRLIGKTASRTNVCALRKHLRYAEGAAVITEEATPMGYVDFAIDAAGKAPGETLRAYLHRFLKELDVKLPDGAVA
jgi:hypothetical protein